jgi:hypothetical protein
MKSLLLCASGLAVVLVADIAAQPPASHGADPRVGLKAGLRNAGVAARNLELVASLPKPAGFFDPAAPAGLPTPSVDDKLPATDPAVIASRAAMTRILSFSNSDLAFDGKYAVLGSFHGFNTYDIESSGKPRLVTSVVCPGGQGDVSIFGTLLFMSVEQTLGRIDCGTQGIQDTVSAERFRGVRIFDISDIKRPRQIAAVQTCRGSHTHTLVVDPKDNANVYLYGSGTSTVRSGEELSGCSAGDKEDPTTSRYSIDVIQVPLAAPEQARVVNRPRIFADQTTGAIAGLWSGGTHGEGTQKTSETNSCHDITVFPEIGLAAGACAGNGILLDISDPVHPVRLDAVADKNFAYWHSATFNNDGTKVVFTDEWGGGTQPRCRATDPLDWGADAVFDIVDRKLQFRGYFKMPAPQSEQENCVAHNGSLVPVPGRDVMVQAWYQGGVSVFDFTDSAHPVEMAFFDRGPLDAHTLILGGYWSAYWYNGAIYGSEIARGLDVFRLTPSEFLSQHEIAAATLVHSSVFNPQAQTRISWPATSLVARAYLDQLTRTNGITRESADAISKALDRADSDRTTRQDGRATELGDLAASVDRRVGTVAGADQRRLQALAAILHAYAERGRQ